MTLKKAVGKTIHVLTPLGGFGGHIKTGGSATNWKKCSCHVCMQFVAQNVIGCYLSHRKDYQMILHHHMYQLKLLQNDMHLVTFGDLEGHFKVI